MQPIDDPTIAEQETLEIPLAEPGVVPLEPIQTPQTNGKGKGGSPPETPRQLPSQMPDASKPRPSARPSQAHVKVQPTPQQRVPPCKVEQEATTPLGSEAKRKLFEDEYTTLTLPPPVLTEKAIDSRLRRVFKPRADGTYPVDEQWQKAWLDAKGDRTKVKALFEKVGYDPDRVSQKSHA